MTSLEIAYDLIRRRKTRAIVDSLKVNSTLTQFLPFLWPNQQSESTEGIVSHVVTHLIRKNYSGVIWKFRSSVPHIWLGSEMPAIDL